MKNTTLLFFIALFVSTLSYTQTDSIPKYFHGTVSELSEQLDDIFNDPNFNNANWGVVIQSLSTGEYFYKRNENKLFMPASNLKLFTTAAGLLLLEPDYKFRTDIFINGNLDGSILNGDLVIRGFGDPTISGRFHNQNVTKVFSDWADTLLELGIDEIRGRIIGDDNAFDEVGLGAGWSWDYETYWYAAQSSALSFNDNCVDIIVKPSKVFEKAEIQIMPNSRYSIILNNVITVPKDSAASIKISRDRGTNVINIFGTIKDHSDSVRLYATVNNPTQYFVVVLKDVLQKKGIKVSGFPVDIDDVSETIDYNKLQYLFSHYSPPMSEIIKVINKSSHNFFAEQLLKVIGYEILGYGTAEDGFNACKEVFTRMNINPDAMIMVDGSGLSRLNLVSPAQVVALLAYMFKSEYANEFYASLPIAGVDGSLANRMKKTLAQGNVRAKTGFIGQVRSLSGLVYTGDNEPIAFSFIVNNFTVPIVLADNIQDLVCTRLATFKRKQ